MRSEQNYRTAKSNTSTRTLPQQAGTNEQFIEPLAGLFFEHDPEFIKYAVFCIQKAFVKHPEAFKATGLEDELLNVLENIYGFCDEYSTEHGKKYIAGIIESGFSHAKR
ncbi:hypothetical protein [Arsenicibacter rosenii]|uniref:hypothetical protein n=1 Tax=Arsenicibacter rosenii TaxID=1750698 RepID=UPI0008F87FF9|nr:hypothetical protein [Arsenicibacter rosenii]